jgi:hypothetical protein
MLRHPAAGELRMCSFWAGGISSFPFSRAREYRMLRRLEYYIYCILYTVYSVCLVSFELLFSFIMLSEAILSSQGLFTKDILISKSLLHQRCSALSIL